MKKIIFAFLIVVFVVSFSPRISEASWWNPISWFMKSTSKSAPIPTSMPAVTKSAPTSILTTSKVDSSKSETIKIKEFTGNEKVLSVKIGDTVKVLGALITVKELVEDSRCPNNAKCIQAGIVRVKISGSYGKSLKKDIIFSLNQIYNIGGHKIKLISVTPQKTAGTTINLSDYVFTFSNEKEIIKDKASMVAQCLKDKGAIFFGASWCPHCQSQKALFGNSAKDLPYIECSTEDQRGQIEICQKNNITGYPTWRFSDGTEQTGQMSIEDLAKKTNCINSK